MADNIDVTPGTGKTIATDEVGGIHYQYVKLSFGGDGTATKVSSTDPIPVTLEFTGGNTTAVKVDGSAVTQPVSAASLPLPTGASTLAEQQTQTTHLSNIAASASVLDDWDESDRAKVNLIAGQVGIAGGTGVDGATVPRVTLATNVALPAGTNAIGKLAANSGVDIGDVDVTSVPTDPFGANADAAATAGGTGTMQAKLRNLTSTNDAIKTAVEIMDDWDETDRAKVNIIAGQAGVTAGAGSVAANTPRVTHASDDPVTTSVQLIDDAIVADDAAFTPATTKVNMAGFFADETSTDSVNEGDGGAARMTLDRKQIVTVAPSATTEGWLTANMTSGDTFTALTNSAQAIKASAGKFGGYFIYNPNASATYVIVYNVASGSVTVGTTTPKLVFCIPATSGANLELVNGITFDTAMSVAAATTGGGNSAPSTALEAMFWYI